MLMGHAQYVKLLVQRFTISIAGNVANTVKTIVDMPINVIPLFSTTLWAKSAEDKLIISVLVSSRK